MSPTALWHGSLGAMSATFAGHYPWFATYNLLNESLPKPVDTLGKLGRNAFMGFCASVISDTTSNSIRVLKTYRQTSEVAALLTCFHDHPDFSQLPSEP